MANRPAAPPYDSEMRADFAGGGEGQHELVAFENTGSAGVLWLETQHTAYKWHRITDWGVLLRHGNSCGFCMTHYFNASSVTQHPRLPPIASHRSP